VPAGGALSQWWPVSTLERSGRVWREPVQRSEARSGRRCGRLLTCAARRQVGAPRRRKLWRTTRYCCSPMTKVVRLWSAPCTCTNRRHPDALPCHSSLSLRRTVQLGDR
jgi:hypothetical protein